MKTIIFARVSTNIQEYDRQVNELTTLANSKGWSVEAISLINNIDRFILDAPIALKIKLLGSMFPEKIEFDGKNIEPKITTRCLTLSISKPMSYAMGKKKTERVFQLSPFQYPRQQEDRTSCCISL